MKRNDAIKYLRDMDTWKAFDNLGDAADLVATLSLIGWDSALFMVDSRIMVWTNAPESILD